jgi:hypothetical protein
MVWPDAASRHSLFMSSLFCSTNWPPRYNARPEGRAPLVAPTGLSSPERGLSFLQVRGDALFRVFALKEKLLQLALDRKSFEESGFGP